MDVSKTILPHAVFRNYTHRSEAHPTQIGCARMSTKTFRLFTPVLLLSEQLPAFRVRVRFLQNQDLAAKRSDGG